MNNTLLRFPGKRKFACPKHFDAAYAKYADSIYGLILKAANGNEQQANALFCQTFTTLFHEISKQPTTDAVGFMQIFAILLRTLKTHDLILAGLPLVTAGTWYFDA